MMVMSRQRDESIMIGDNVEVVIIDVRGDKVRLGITAPKSIPVHRREIYDAIQREKSHAKECRSQPRDVQINELLPKKEGQISPSEKTSVQ